MGAFIASFAAAVLTPLPLSISTIADIVYSKMIAVRRIVGIVTEKPAFRPYENERSNPVSSPLQLPCTGLFHTLKHPRFPNFT